MRLGDLDALMELYDMGKELEEYAEVLSVPIHVIRQNIKDMPTIDAVPVVRCKDCKHYYRPLQWPVEYTKGMCDVDLFERRVHPDDFCSYGERKEAEDDG